MKNGLATSLSNNSISDTFLSTDDNSFKHLKPMLQGLFPEPSTLEKLAAATNSLYNSNTKVCIFSLKNASWPGVGKIYRGHNLVTEEQAALWYSKGFVRVSTEKEAIDHFGEAYKKLKFDGFGKYNP
jgi:hypothetical protein